MTETMRDHGFRAKHTLEEDMAAGLYPYQRMCNCGRIHQDKVHQNAEANRRDLDSRIRAANIRPRDAARVILAAIPKHGDPVVKATVEAAVSDLIDEVDHWKDSWAAVTVDKDHSVRRAMARSEQCPAHGEEIRALKSQVWHFSQAADRMDQARLVLLGWYQVCKDFVDGYQSGGAAVRPNSQKIVEWMAKNLPKVSAAHQRVFTATTKPEPTEETKTPTREGA